MKRSSTSTRKLSASSSTPLKMVGQDWRRGFIFGCPLDHLTDQAVDGCGDAPGRIPVGLAGTGREEAAQGVGRWICGTVKTGEGVGLESTGSNRKDLDPKQDGPRAWYD